MLLPFTTVPHALVTTNHKSILLLLHNYNFDTVINHIVNTRYKAISDKGHDSQVDNPDLSAVSSSWHILFVTLLSTTIPFLKVPFPIHSCF